MSKKAADAWLIYEAACANMQSVLEENAWMETIEDAAKELIDSIKYVYQVENED